MLIFQQGFSFELIPNFTQPKKNQRGSLGIKRTFLILSYQKENQSLSHQKHLKNQRENLSVKTIFPNKSQSTKNQKQMRNLLEN